MQFIRSDSRIAYSYDEQLNQSGFGILIAKTKEAVWNS